MGTIIANLEHVLLSQMMAQRSALGLEITGLRFKQGSICAFIKKQHKIKARTKKEVYKQLHEMIVKREKELGIPEKPLTDSQKRHLEA